MVTGIDLVRCQILSRAGPRPARPGDGPAAAGQDAAERLRAAVPRHDGRSGEQLHARLRQDPHLPIAGGLRHPARRRLRVRRRGDHAVLRLAAGEADGVGPRLSARLPAHGPRAARVPHPRRQDQHPVPRERRQPRRVSRSGKATTRFLDETPELFRFMPRQDRATKAADLPRRSHRQRQSGGRGKAGAAGAEEPRRFLRTIVGAPPPGTRQIARQARAGRGSPSGRRSRSGCCSPTPRSATRTSRCWPRACARTTCWRSPTSSRTDCRSSTAWRCGAARRSTWRCASCSKIPWKRLRRLRERSEHLLPDAAARVERGRLHGVSRQRGARSSSRKPREQGMDIFRIFDSLNWLPNMKVAMEAVRDDRQGLRSRHLLHRRHSRSRSATSTRSSTTCAWRRSWSGWARTSSASRTWPACASPYAAEQLVQDAEARKSAFRSTSTRTTRAGINAASILKAAEAGVDVADAAIVVDERHDQPAESELDRRRARAHAARHGTRSGRAQPVRGLLGDRSHATTRRSTTRRSRARPKSTCTRCPAGSTRILRSRPRRWGWPSAGTRLRGRMPTSTWRSATS